MTTATRIKLFSAFGILILCTAACHKKDDPEVYLDYLQGTMTFDAPQFVRPGSTHTFTPRGITNPRGEGLGYYWAVSWRTARDTVKTQRDPSTVDSTFTVTFPDSLATFTVTCGAFADSCYSSVSEISVTVVDDALGASLTATGISITDPSFTDGRDGNIYYTTTVADKVWMRQNLAWTGSGLPYVGCEVMSRILGNYYTWEEAVKACPEGWHLSGAKDWTDLAKSLGCDADISDNDPYNGVSGGIMVYALFNGARLWEYWPDVKVDNRSGLSVIPSGYATTNGNRTRFEGSADYAVFWTSEEKDGELAYYRYINVNKPDILKGLGDKQTFRASVRCVKD